MEDAAYIQYAWTGSGNTTTMVLSEMYSTVQYPETMHTEAAIT
jgi:hypothetical protein